MPDDMKEPLPIPPGVASDPEAREMIRAWIADQGLHCSLNLGMWGEDEAVGWGVLLSDIARHVARALHDQSGANADEILQEIRDSFDSEMDEPPSNGSDLVQIK